MTRSRSAVFIRVLAGLLLVQGALGVATWLLLPWATQTWLDARGRHLARAAEAVAAGFTAAEVSAVAAGDTASPRFSAALDRLEKVQRDSSPPAGATAALFAVEPGPAGPRLSIRIASYPPYQPDDGMAPASPSQVDRDCIDRVLAGVACHSPRPYGGGDPGEATLISGYAPIRGADGTVKAVAAVDWNVLPLHTLQGAARWACIVAGATSTVLLPLMAWLLAGRLVMRQVPAPQEAPAAGEVSSTVVREVSPETGEQASLPLPPGELVSPVTRTVGVPVPAVSPFLSAIDARWDALSEREVELVGYVGQALSTRDIAERMCVQESTVKQHLKNVYRELGIHSREELVVISVYKFGFRLEGSSASADET